MDKSFFDFQISSLPNSTKGRSQFNHRQRICPPEGELKLDHILALRSLIMTLGGRGQILHLLMDFSFIHLPLTNLVSAAISFTFSRESISSIIFSTFSLFKTVRAKVRNLS